jgi:hypothetical protein
MNIPSKSAAGAADKGVNATVAKIKVRTMESLPPCLVSFAPLFHFVNGKPDPVESANGIEFYHEFHRIGHKRSGCASEALATIRRAGR